MGKRFGKDQAIAAVDKFGGLLVFPMKGKKEPRSLWSVFYPRSEMRWEWDESGDDRVVRLWYLRADLAASLDVVYSKWYQARASVFRKNLLPALLRTMNSDPRNQKFLPESYLSSRAKQMLSLLEENSPLSTKQLKQELGLKGANRSAEFDRCTKELFARFLIAGVGEVDDGAFPSLALGATKLYFDREWLRAEQVSYAESFAELTSAFEKNPSFLNQLQKYQKKFLHPQMSNASSKEIVSVVSWEDL